MRKEESDIESAITSHDRVEGFSTFTLLFALLTLKFEIIPMFGCMLRKLKELVEIESQRVWLMDR